MYDYKTIKVGSGTKVHYGNNRAICGSGTCGIGTRKNSRVFVIKAEVTCDKCISKYNEMKAWEEASGLDWDKHYSYNGIEIDIKHYEEVIDGKILISFSNYKVNDAYFEVYVDPAELEMIEPVVVKFNEVYETISGRVVRIKYVGEEYSSAIELSTGTVITVPTSFLRVYEGKPTDKYLLKEVGKWY